MTAEAPVDEYLSEKEQIELIKQWWREYGWYLIGGAAVSVLGYFGLNQYRLYQDGMAEEAGALYREMLAAVEDDRDDVDGLLARLRAEYASSPYTDQAGLLMAKHLLIQDSERAARELRLVMENASDQDLAMIARLRLARVQAYREDYAAALAVLEVEEAGQFAARISEIKGDIHVALGEADAARSAYIQALTAAGADSLDRNFVQMKLNDVLAAEAVGGASEDGG